MFSYGSSSSISFATVTPSLVTVGEPNFLSSTTLRPLGPKVAVTALESLATPRRIAWRAASSNNSCFAAIILSWFLFVQWLLNDRQNVVGAHDFVLLAIQLDFRAAVLAHQHPIALLDFKANLLPVVIGLPVAERDDEAFVRFFLGGIGNDDAAFLDFLLFERLNEEPISEGFHV